MQSAQPLSPFASRFSSHSRFTSRLRALLLRCWRVFWLATGVWFLWASLSAGVEMASVFNGKMQPTVELLARADHAVARFPFDPHLRGARIYVHEKIATIPPYAGPDDAPGK